MPVVHAARSGARFRGDDGEDRIVLQIERGSWPLETALRLVETRAVPSLASREALAEEEIYESSCGLKLWAARCDAESG